MDHGNDCYHCAPTGEDSAYWAKTLNTAFVEGQAISAKEIEAFVTLVKTGRVKMDELIAERDQLKARWEKLKVYGASLSMGIDSRLRDKMKELEQ